MKPTMNRDEYESFRPNSLREYPVSAEAASSELRARGYDCRPWILNRLLAKGAIPPLAEGQGAPKWTADAIDAAAIHLDAEGAWTPGAITADYLGTTYGAMRRAQEEAQKRYPGVFDFTIRVVPGAVGVGLPARVEYVPTTPEDIRIRDEQIQALKSRRGDG